MKDKWNSERRSNEPDVFGCPFQAFELKVKIIDNLFSTSRVINAFPNLCPPSNLLHQFWRSPFVPKPEGFGSLGGHLPGN